MSSNLTSETVIAEVEKHLSEDLLRYDNVSGVLVIEVESKVINSIIKYLKSNATLKFSFLTLIGAVHYPSNENKELAVIYHLHSLENNFRLRIKTYLSIQNPEIDSIVDIFQGANWLERETFDFFGINFKNHPDLRRILNDESMDYFPMRKEYQLEDSTRLDKDDRFFGR